MILGSCLILSFRAEVLINRIIAEVDLGARTLPVWRPGTDGGLECFYA